MIRTEADIERLVLSDRWMVEILQAAEQLNLPDWWIGAGFLRNKVWDAIEGNQFVKPRDVDLVYFNSEVTAAEADWQYDEEMNTKFPGVEWEVRNQARMHLKNGFDPYSSTAEGIANWVETATCVAVKMEKSELKFLFCHGVDDLVNVVARPVPKFSKPPLLDLFNKRIADKKWQQRWPSLRIEGS